MEVKNEIMFYQIENVNKEIEIIQKEPNNNFGVENTTVESKIQWKH